MVEYTKKWLSLDQQVDRLIDRGLEVEDPGRAAALLKSIGYYRVTGYLYPFLQSDECVDDEGQPQFRILNKYRPGTALHHAESIIDFDRQLRILVLEGVERIEVAVRMRAGYVLGRSSAFAHEDPACFDDSFTRPGTDSRDPHSSKHVEWLKRVKDRRDNSDEMFVGHFRTKYEDRMPIWALTELLEMGHLSTLFRGMLQKDAEELADAFGVSKKKLMTSWLASLNYVRNVAAHHARLFNRKLQNAPSRPTVGTVPVLDHLRAPDAPKQDFGTYNALAVIAYLLQSIEAEPVWANRLGELLREFPASHALTIQSMGVPENWESLNLWTK
ncbi:Abi family protein [Mycetocola miduiensis]|uniref:Abortive infection bacteriophage resistance protein n=1 Tax=Mycetocola miduiensis TaxID=995034 RepID=A0A1I4ZVB6_9MICO|nr:Abi family protein [Mycetocola miduiensis]SFN54184.1 Abortive infection bacteriophage resistance protein [Mycetocola miduiensis]